VGIAGLPSLVLDCVMLRVYPLALLLQSMLYCSQIVSGRLAFWSWCPFTCRNCGVSGAHLVASVLSSIYTSRSSFVVSLGQMDVDVIIISTLVITPTLSQKQFRSAA